MSLKARVWLHLRLPLPHSMSPSLTMYLNTPQLVSWETGVAVVAALALYNILNFFFRRSPLDNFRCPPGAKFFEGHMGLLFDVKTGLEFSDRLMEEYGAAAKVKGPFGADQIFISDPRGLEHILLGAAWNYDEMALVTARANFCFGPSVIGVVGNRHSTHRRLLNPAFSRGQTSKLFPLCYDIGCQLKERLAQVILSNEKHVDILHWASAATMEFIALSGFGYRFGALEEKPDDAAKEYKNATRLLLPTLAQLGSIEVVGSPISTICPAWIRRLAVDLCPISIVQNLKHMIDTMHNTSVSIYQGHKRRLEQEDSDMSEISMGWQDALTIIMKANSRLEGANRLSEAEITAQLSTLMFAGTESLAGSIARLFGLIASHQDIQAKIRKEVASVQTDNKLNHEELMALPLLDAVCRETLRVYPPVTRMPRTCLQDDTIPLQNPVQSTTNSSLYEMPVPKGTTVWLDILGANMNREIWGDDACDWKPERWLPFDANGKPKLPGCYSHMMTFLGGSRSCLGFRMSILQMKVLVALLLPVFRFEPSGKTIVWHLGVTQSPYVEGEEKGGPKLPVNLSLVTGS